MTKTFNIRAIPSANVSVYDRTPFTTGYGLYIRSAGRISLVAPKLCALFPTFPSPPLNSICPIRFFSGYGCSRQGWEPCHGMSQSTWLGLDSLPSPFGAPSLKSLVLFSPSPALSRALLNGLSADCWILHGCPKGPCGLRKWSLKGPAAACRLL